MNLRRVKSMCSTKGLNHATEYNNVRSEASLHRHMFDFSDVLSTRGAIIVVNAHAIS